MKVIFRLVMVLVLCVGFRVQAQEMTPDALVKNVTDEVLQLIKQDKDIQSGSSRKLAELVDAKVLPHFNFARMAQLAVGKEWQKATPQQKQLVTAEFKTLLVRTYSTALADYKNQRINYKPTKFAPADQEVTVKTEILQPGGKPVQLYYALEKTDNGWKVFDVIVGEVSLVYNYRNDFTTEIRNSGFDGLITSLTAKNKSQDSKGSDRK
ncbi:MAG: phospholipid transporter substrate-binding protein [Pseudomonadota bacterium]|jgi:phospholipid transport system substrate-binding protein